MAMMRGYYQQGASRLSFVQKTSGSGDKKVEVLLEQIFEMMDTTKDGNITAIEGARVGNALFGDNSDALSWWNDLMQRSDTDGNGSLDINEWMAYMTEEYLVNMDPPKAYATLRFMSEQLSHSNLTVLHGHGVASFMESKVSKPVATSDLPWLKDKKKKKKPAHQKTRTTPTTQLWTGGDDES